MDSILASGTWEITDRPYGCQPLGCKWVFKRKLRPDGTVEKYKARLLAKGYIQKEEDFFDTYSPVARLPIIRVLLSLAASHGLLIYQMDIKTHYYRMLLTRHYDQRPFDETVCDAIIANGGVKNHQKRCKTFAMEDASNTIHILVACAMQGIRFSSINCLR
jgi:hypothetical protein